MEVYVDLKSELALESRNSWVIQLVYAYSPNSPAAAYYANCDSSSGLSGQQFDEKSATTTTRSSITMNEVKWSGVAWRGVVWYDAMRSELLHAAHNSTECYTSRRKQTALFFHSFLGSFARAKRDNWRLAAFHAVANSLKCRNRPWVPWLPWLPWLPYTHLTQRKWNPQELRTQHWVYPVLRSSLISISFVRNCGEFVLYCGLMAVPSRSNWRTTDFQAEPKIRRHADCRLRNAAMQIAICTECWSGN